MDPKQQYSGPYFRSKSRKWAEKHKVESESSPLPKGRTGQVPAWDQSKDILPALTDEYVYRTLNPKHTHEYTKVKVPHTQGKHQ